MGNFLKGFVLTAVPAAAIGIYSAIRARMVGYFDDAIGYFLLWLLAPIAFIVTMIIGLTVPGLKKTKTLRAGVLAGIGFAVVALGVSCFAMATS